MAVAAPVLEREIDTTEVEFTREYHDTYMTEEEKHNSRIKSNYAKLINPETRVKDIILKEPVQNVKEVNFAAPAEPAVEYADMQEVQVQKPYLVENARADADIFRADSPINRRVVEAAAAPVICDEDENEDLRPTQTTIQYKTSGVKKTEEEGKIAVRSEAKRRTHLTKKDKIIVAIAITVIIALFTLIIVNSAVISNLNNNVSDLQSTLTVAEDAYNEALTAKNAYLEESNLLQVVSDFAVDNGMFLR